MNKPLPLVYIAGPMRGYQSYNFDAFHAVGASIKT